MDYIYLVVSSAFFPWCKIDQYFKFGVTFVQVDGTATEERIDTDKNMLTMFNILRKNRRVRLEHLVLNRNSFAQTVENLFTLSFLVKDGRAEIVVDEKGFHLVCKILCKYLSFVSFISSFLSLFFFFLITLTYNFFPFSAPKNAPSADAVASKVVSYNHFVFRFDFKDWKVLWKKIKKLLCALQ